ncbi:MAG: 30S ribosomal protein S24e [Candidatus Thorarchaeota archaeon]
MSFKVEIIEEKKNPLINRKEITFRVEHFGAGTPNRLEIKKKIAAMKNASEKLTIIRKIYNTYGYSSNTGIANIYESSKDLQFFEPFYIRVRNLPKETRSEVYKLKKRKEAYKHLFEYE